MATNAKICIKHGYTLHFNEDDTLFLKVETADETLEFDGASGVIFFSSECVDEDELAETTKATFEELISYAKEHFEAWGIDEETAEALICDLTPWFKKFAISEEESRAIKIDMLESWIKGRREAIKSCVKSIDNCRREISVYEERIGYEVSQILKLNEDIEDLSKQIAELKSSLKGERFISVDPEYTGGGIYVFTGHLADGNYFMADTSFYDVRIVNEAPNIPDDMSNEESWEKYGVARDEDAWASVEWQEEHLVKDLTPDEAVAFFKEMFKWIEVNKPDGNYLPSDMDYFRNEVENLHGDWR